MTNPKQHKIELSPLQSFAYDAALQNNRAIRQHMTELQEQIMSLQEQIEQAQKAGADELEAVMASIMAEHKMEGYPFSPCKVISNRGDDGKVVELVFEETDSETFEQEQQPEAEPQTTND